MATQESARKNRELGGTLTVIGIATLVALPVIAWVEPIPTLEQLHRNEVTLASTVRLIDTGRGVRAELVWTDGLSYASGRIPSLSVCVSPGARKTLEAARPGQRLFVEAASVGDARDREYQVWGLRLEGEVIINYSDSAAAQRALARNTMYIGLGALGLGFPLLVVGYRQKGRLRAAGAA